MTSALVVNVDTLNVRDGPCSAARLFTRIDRGALLLNMGGPVSVDGYRWYLVALDLTGDLPTAGWVAAGTTADTWLRPASVSCPVPSLATIANLGTLEQQACWGHTQSLSFAAHQAATPADAGFGGGCGELEPNQPAWLWCWNINYNFVNSDGGPLGGGQPTLQLFFDPNTGIKPLGLAPVGTIGPAYQIRGHFYDRWSSLCPPASTQGTIDWDRAVLRCQVEFVVESLQRVP